MRLPRTEVNAMPEPGVVTCFDGSAASARALEWAATEAKMRRVPLTVCHAWQTPDPSGALPPAVNESARQAAKGILARGMVVAEHHAPGVPVRSRLLAGPAAPALVYAADGAELLVAGARGAGGSCWPGLGSVSAQLAAHASCPVEIIRGDGAWRGGGVVAGVDGSPSSQNAAGFAFEEAAMRGVPLTVVTSWWEPTPADATATADSVDDTAPPILDVAALRTRALDRAALAVSQWREKYPDVTVTSSASMRAPRAAVCAAAQTAGLLVVGARGLGGMPGLLLGSVSHAVLEDAPCPVAVLRS
jgi:nucleotide-binding universal stress UspA family protein